MVVRCVVHQHLGLNVDNPRDPAVDDPWERVFKAQRLLYYSTLGLRVIKKKKKIRGSIGSFLRIF